MATYVNNLRLKEIATGDESGTWGTSTNTNLELIGESLGYATQEAFSSDANATTTVADGASDPARALYFKVTSGASLTATRELTIGPNTNTRVMWIENATTGSQSITIKQGSGATITIPTGKTKIVYLDGAGAGAAVVDALSLVDFGTVTSVQMGGGTTGLTYSGGPITGSGTITTGGTLAVANGGTGLASLVGADIASATTVNLTAATGNVVVITGTTTTTAFTMNKGQQMVLIADAAWPMTFNATTCNINGGASYTCAAGDRVYITKDDNDVIRVSVTKQDGTALVAPSGDVSQALTDGATINWDVNSGNVATVTIAGNRIFAAPTNMVVGAMVLKLTQDGTGSRTITWNSAFKWSAGTPPVLSTAANAVDIISFFSDGTNAYGTLALRGAAA